MDETESGFEGASTEALLAIRENLLVGLEVVSEHMKAGTLHKSSKEGSVPPVQSGWLTMIFLLSVEDELESRIRGFQRVFVPVRGS